MLIYLSPADNFISSSEVLYLKERIKLLPIWDEVFPVQNLFLVATGADALYEDDNPDVLNGILAEGYQNLWDGIRTEYEDMKYYKENLAERFFVYSTVDVDLSDDFEIALEMLIEDLPELIKTYTGEKLQKCFRKHTEQYYKTLIDKKWELDRKRILLELEGKDATALKNEIRQLEEDCHAVVCFDFGF